MSVVTPKLTALLTFVRLSWKSVVLGFVVFRNFGKEGHFENACVNSVWSSRSLPVSSAVSRPP